MQRELWYPNLHPPVEHFMLSVLYGEGFASVLPSWTLRESHPAWAELEQLQDVGLYEPLRLRDLLSKPEVEQSIPAHLSALAHRVGMTPSASPYLQAWSRAVLEGEPMEPEAPVQAEAALTAPPGRVGPEEEFVARPGASFPPGSLMETLAGDFAFGVDSSGSILRAPREVIDEVVRLAVAGAATTRPDLAPTTEFRSAHGRPGGIPLSSSQVGWWVHLPAPPANWSLTDVLGARELNEEALLRVRERISQLPPPEPGADFRGIGDHLSRQLKRDLRGIRREFGDDPRRDYAKMVAPIVAEAAVGEALAGVMPNWGVAGAVGVAVVTGLALPGVRERLPLVAARVASFAYARPAALSAGRA